MFHCTTIVSLLQTNGWMFGVHGMDFFGFIFRCTNPLSSLSGGVFAQRKLGAQFVLEMTTKCKLIFKNTDGK